MNIEKIIESAGLSSAESKVYLSLIKLGSSMIGPILRESGLNSSVAYNCLQRLMGYGLVSYNIKGKKKYFFASDPKNLIYILKDKENALLEAMPLLEKLKNTAKNRQEIFIFEGPKAARTVFNDILDTLKKGDEHLVIGVSESDSGMGEFIKKWDEKRVERGILKRVIVTEKESNWLEYYKKQPLAKVKALKDVFNMRFTINVYGNKTALVIWGRYPTYILIERKEVAENFRNYFNFLWRSGR
jgi:sugar-specific transcriptional regulator TrmB